MKDSYLDINSIFNKDFPDVELTLKIVQLEKGLSHCLFIQVQDELHLAKNWERITNSIALNYQGFLETSFEKWNMYLFFLVSKKLSNLDLKYTIENNTFSSRKIVEDTDKTIKDLIQTHIDNKLELESRETISDTSDFEYNPIIWDTLKDKTIKKVNILYEEQMKTYEELIAKLKQKNEI